MCRCFLPTSLKSTTILEVLLSLKPLRISSPSNQNVSETGLLGPRAAWPSTRCAASCCLSRWGNNQLRWVVRCFRQVTNPQKHAKTRLHTSCGFHSSMFNNHELQRLSLLARLSSHNEPAQVAAWNFQSVASCASMWCPLVAWWLPDGSCCGDFGMLSAAF